MAKLTGGDQLKKKLEDMAKNLSSGATAVKVGFLEAATYSDGQSVPLVAAINEYGAPKRGQPPRPFFRNMIAAKSKEWPRAVSALMEANDFDAQRTLELTGEAISGQLRQSIRDLVDPPLKPSTIARKGHGKPLIETGQMLNSVGYEVI